MLVDEDLVELMHDAVWEPLAPADAELGGDPPVAHADEEAADAVGPMETSAEELALAVDALVAPPEAPPIAGAASSCHIGFGGWVKCFAPPWSAHRYIGRLSAWPADASPR